MSDFVTAWETLFGIYTPLSYLDENGNMFYMTDWGYVMRCAFFILVVFCILKMIGGVLKNDKR